MMDKRIRWLAILISLAVAAALLTGCAKPPVVQVEGGGLPKDKTLTVQGAGSVMVEPDIASITVGALTSDADAAAAQDQSAGALLLHAGGLVDLAVSLFERTWRSASHLRAAPEGGIESVGLDQDEREVLALLDVGLTDRAIATRTGVSLRTVQRRVRDLMERADVETRMQLGVAAVRRGWL